MLQFRNLLTAIVQSPGSEKNAAVFRVVVAPATNAGQRGSFQNWNIWTRMSHEDPRMSKDFISLMWFLWECKITAVDWFHHDIMRTGTENDTLGSLAKISFALFDLVLRIFTFA